MSITPTDAIWWSACRPFSSMRLAFDEQLPLYGWLEDVDFSRSIARYGRSVRVEGARGVHLGVKSGRQPGLRLGYSQVANPAYLIRKGTMSKARAIAQIGRNILAKRAALLLNDRSIDRLGTFGRQHAGPDRSSYRSRVSVPHPRIRQSLNREMSSPSIATKRR